MNKNDVIFIERSEIEQTGAKALQWCSCGCPVVVAEGSMDAHIKRCHTMPAAAKPGINARKWERAW